MILAFVLIFLYFRHKFKDLTDWFITLLFIVTMLRTVDLTLFIIISQNPYVDNRFLGVNIYDFTYLQCVDIIYIITTFSFSLLFLIHEVIIKIKKILK